MNTAINGRKLGYNVILCDSFEKAVEKASAWADTYLKGRVEKGRLTAEEADFVKQHLTITSDVDGAAAKADFIIEAIIEDLKVKRELFQRISRICKPDAILSTNSSNIVSSKLADVTENPSRLLNHCCCSCNTPSFHSQIPPVIFFRSPQRSYFITVAYVSIHYTRHAVLSSFL